MPAPTLLERLGIIRWVNEPRVQIGFAFNEHPMCPACGEALGLEFTFMAPGRKSLEEMKNLAARERWLEYLQKGTHADSIFHAGTPCAKP
jgi:hypothetical protein